MIEKARRYRKIIESLTVNLDDETALTSVDLFPHWAEDGEYAVDDRVQYEGVLYRCLQAHTAQAAWIPTDAVSLWARVLIPDPHDIPEWVQPGSTNPYMRGDKVRHVGRVWESLIDGNVWEPGAVGTESLWAERSA